MHDFLVHFIQIDVAIALQVILLGFIGGVLSGFIGSGGAFFMTPGMMNLGVEGVVAVASNITHKFGKAMVGSRKHGEAGNVDKRLAVCVLVTAIGGIQLAVWINSFLFKGGSGHGASQGAGANLYISLVFVFILLAVAISMLRDVLRHQHRIDLRLADFLDIDVHRYAHHVRQFTTQPLDVFALLADDDAGPGRVDRDPRGLRRPLDVDSAHGRLRQPVAQEFAHLQIVEQVLRVLLLVGVPDRIVSPDDAEAKTVRIDLLTHESSVNPAPWRYCRTPSR